MRLGPALVFICYFTASAQADGPTALELQQRLRAGSINENQNAAAISVLQQTLLATQGLATAAVATSGGNVSQTLIQIPTNFNGIKSVPHSIADKFTRDYDPHDFGATGDALLLPLAASAPAGTTKLQFAADARIVDPSKAGLTSQYVGQIGIPASTQIASISTSGGMTNVTLTNPLSMALTAGTFICVAGHDDQPAFQAAEVAAFHANSNTGQGVVLAGHGVYYLSKDVYNQGEVDVRLDGARVFGAFIGGGGNAIGVQQTGSSEVRLVSSSSISPTNVYFGEMDMIQPSSSAGTQKAVFNATMRTSDSQDAAIGFYAKPSFAGNVQGGQEWAFQTQVQIPGGTDGYALMFEGGLENNASYQPEYGGLNTAGFSNAKIGIHVGCSGPVDCTAANVVAGFGGRWHYGLWFKPNAIRSDGYALAVAGPTGGLLASISATGSVAAQQGSFSGNITTTGALAIRGNLSNVASNTVNGIYLGTNASGVVGEGDIVGVRGLNIYGVPASSTMTTGATAAIAVDINGSARLISTPVNTQTGNYTLSSAGADCGTTIRATSSAAVTYTVPSGLPIGCRVEIFQTGVGPITFAAGSGQTIEAFGGATHVIGQYGTAQLFIDSLVTFRLSGQVQ